jgi:hypothetical protein
MEAASNSAVAATLRLSRNLNAAAEDECLTR